MSEFLTKRAGFWHYARRVPAAFVEIDPRGVIRQSTRIRIADDPKGKRAKTAADRINDELEAFWRSTLAGGGDAARARYDKARVGARRLGFEYITAAEIASRPIAEILERIEALASRSNGDDHDVVASVLGGVEPPPSTLTACSPSSRR